MTATAPATRTDRYGFPVTACTRCSGTGDMPHFRGVQGGVCFGCSGTGAVHPAGTVRRLATQWRAELEAARTVRQNGAQVDIAADGTWTEQVDLAPGDTVREWSGDEWRTVAAVRPTARVVGTCIIGDRVTYFRKTAVVTFTDGTRVETSGCMWRRRPDLDALRARMAELAGQARTAHERQLARQR